MSIQSNANQPFRGDARRRPLFSGAIDWCRWRTVLLATMIAACMVATAARDHALIEAARNRDLSSLRALLEKETDPNVRQGDGATALHWAAHWDDMTAATLLFHAGADVNAINDNGVTALA